MRRFNRLAAELPCRVLHSLDDILVTGAPAQVAGYPVANFLVGRTRVFLEQPVRAYNHAGSAEPTLQAMLLHEAFLQGVEHTTLGETLNGQHLGVLCLHGQHRA
jgi:hypothetical protein